ncbi:MAG: Rid family hydrolase [Hyphomicrobiaceae bacterium]
MLDVASISDRSFQCRSFAGARGGAEHYVAITAPPGFGLTDGLDYVEARYREALQSLHLPAGSAVFRRIFLSDAINQGSVVRGSTLFDDPEVGPAAVSIVQQPPLPGAKVALLAYHVGGKLKKRRVSSRHLLVEKNGTRHLWSTRLCADGRGAPGSAETQTWEVFSDLISALALNGAELREHCVRTWLYIKDVDVFYRGMVESRGRIFRQHGLTEDTHYIASTGIEGACGHQYDVVLMDAYSNLDMKPGQMTYLQDLDRLCPTKAYNVHFERGTKVSYRDRAHHFISGTASIDSAGKVVHPGDVLKQLERTLDNVDGLLASGGAALEDMTHLIVYLRDAADFARIRDCLGERLPGLPAVYVKGPVCRPEWLIEVEGIAVKAHTEPQMPAF